jgi:hypothetical protein
MSADDPGDEALGQSDQERIANTIRAITERRALIEQTKGMLMFVYGIDADDAFELLRWQSQQHNVKLRLISEQISKDLVELSRANGPARRHAIDGLMLTAHQRIAHVAARQMDGQSKTDV